MPDAPAELAELLKRYDRILVAAHANPDGDAVGSCVALGWALRELDKNVLLYNATGFPDYLTWLRLPSPTIWAIPDTAAFITGSIRPCPPPAKWWGCWPRPWARL